MDNTPNETTNEEELDPEIGIILNELNETIQVVNQLECSINNYIKERVMQLQKQIGSKTIKKAQLYYNLLMANAKANHEISLLTVEYKKASDELQNAKIINKELEEQFNSMHASETTKTIKIDENLQNQMDDVLNAFVNAKNKYQQINKIYTETLKKFNSTNTILKDEFKKHKNAILKSKPYYYFLYCDFLKNDIDHKLTEMKHSHKNMKSKIKELMAHLESISLQIHIKRDHGTLINQAQNKVDESIIFDYNTTNLEGDDSTSLSSAISENISDTGSIISDIKYDDFIFE